MTPAEIAQWKAEQQKKPLVERLATIPGHQVEPERADLSQLEPRAEAGYDDVQKLRGEKNGAA
jgi:hypothetical protein